MIVAYVTAANNIVLFVELMDGITLINVSWMLGTNVTALMSAWPKKADVKNHRTTTTFDSRITFK